MFDFRPDNRNPSIVHVSWRGIPLGRLMQLRKTDKRQKNVKYTIVDVDALDIIPRSNAWNACRRPDTREAHADRMKTYHKAKRAA